MERVRFRAPHSAGPRNRLFSELPGGPHAAGCGRGTAGSRSGAVCRGEAVSYLGRHPEKENLFLLISFAVGWLEIICITFKPYPMDYVNGVLLVDPQRMMNDGYGDICLLIAFPVARYIEKTWIRFRPAGLKNVRADRSRGAGSAVSDDPIPGGAAGRSDGKSLGPLHLQLYHRSVFRRALAAGPPALHREEKRRKRSRLKGGRMR